MGSCEPNVSGELNYILTMQCILYLQGKILGARPTYADIAEVLSALDESQAEIRRRLLAPLEERKIKENGDIFPEEWTK